MGRRATRWWQPPQEAAHPCSGYEPLRHVACDISHRTRVIGQWLEPDRCRPAYHGVIGSACRRRRHRTGRLPSGVPWDAKGREFQHRTAEASDPSDDGGGLRIMQGEDERPGYQQHVVDAASHLVHKPFQARQRPSGAKAVVQVDRGLRQSEFSGTAAKCDPMRFHSPGIEGKTPKVSSDPERAGLSNAEAREFLLRHQISSQNGISPDVCGR